MAQHVPDLLEQAHLGHLRGRTSEARYLLDQLLSIQPDCEDALTLRERMEAEIVEEAAVENQRREQEIRAQLPGPQVILIALLGLLALVAGIWTAVHVVQLGLAIGFGAQAPMWWAGNGASRHYPVHLGLLPAILLVAAGAYGLRVVYINVRAFTSSG